MANPEHVEIARRGSDAVTEWCEGGEDGARRFLDLVGANLNGIDLRGADLDGASLHGADLANADLSGAFFIETDLTSANLSRASLCGALLSHAYLTGAILIGANLYDANLSSAYLIGADLSDANLSHADLSSAHLNGANLSGADLWRANFCEADLADSNLSGARLHYVDLTDADLTRASLRGAEVDAVNFTGASLRETDVARARFHNSMLGDVDLSRALGLAQARHVGPSSIGIDTLSDSFRGAGNTLTSDLSAFLRGAGVPQGVLDALPRILEEIVYFSCFISYGQPDLGLAQRIYKDLQAKGISCWLYDSDKTPGERTQKEISERMGAAERVVVLCSADALVRDGILKEIEKLIDETPDKIVPVSADELWKHPGFKVMRGPRDLKPFLLDRNYADFSNKRRYDKALNLLLKGLRRPPH